MTYRKLGNTGVRVSPLCLGTFNFGGSTPSADAVQMIHTALDAARDGCLAGAGREPYLFNARFLRRKRRDCDERRDDQHLQDTPHETLPPGFQR